MQPRATPARSSTRADNASEPAARSPDRSRESPSPPAPRRTARRATRTQPSRSAAAARPQRAPPPRRTRSTRGHGSCSPTSGSAGSTTRSTPPCHTTNAARAQKKTEPQSGNRGGRHAQPTAATSTAGTPIQKIRDWLEPSLKKSARNASPAAAAPQTTGQRIAREANRAAGRIQESPPRVRTPMKWSEIQLTKRLQLTHRRLTAIRQGEQDRR